MNAPIKKIRAETQDSYTHFLQKQGLVGKTCDTVWPSSQDEWAVR
jgi:hypothetical protein